MKIALIVVSICYLLHAFGTIWLARYAHIDAAEWGMVALLILLPPVFWLVTAIYYGKYVIRRSIKRRRRNKEENNEAK
ncbi:MAG: hypothetical protein NC218_01555 [Acetobacter sp.]|nr:hypothetical protein [Acetobacter sp.]